MFPAVPFVTAWFATLLFRGSVPAPALSGIPGMVALLLPHLKAETGGEQLSPLPRDQSR